MEGMGQNLKEKEKMKHEFQYISKNDPEIKEKYQNILDFLHDVQNEVREYFTFRYDIVGSYKRNMITYDTKSNVGYDFDFNIEVNDDECNYEAYEIKEYIIKAMKKYMYQYELNKIENSTRVITVKSVSWLNARVIYSCDFAIVNNYEDQNGKRRQQYIRFNKENQTYSWCEQPEGFYKLPEKINWIKKNDLWDEVREKYLLKKNTNNDPDAHSRSIYALTINEVCQQNGYFWRR